MDVSVSNVQVIKNKVDCLRSDMPGGARKCDSAPLFSCLLHVSGMCDDFAAPGLHSNPILGWSSPFLEVPLIAGALIR